MSETYKLFVLVVGISFGSLKLVYRIIQQLSTIMNTTRLFWSLAILSCYVNSYCQENTPANTPNVILIICDDLNDAIHGMGGHPQAITPNIDELCKQGVRFINAQCNAPICGPSRASLWSGLYPHTTGYFGYSQQENHWRNNGTLKNTITLFEHLSQNGYQVYATGKIHHNGHEDYSIFRNEDGSNGFMVKASFGPYPWDGDKTTAVVNIRGVRHPDMPDQFPDFTWGEGFGEVKDISHAYGGQGSWLYDHWGEIFKIDAEGKRDLMPDERCTEYALSVLRENHKKPFFITIGYNRPHTPLYVPEKYFDLYPIDSLKVAPFLEDDIQDCAQTALLGKDLIGITYGRYKYKRVIDAGGKELFRKWTQSYLASVSFVDDQIGYVMDALEKSEFSENTIVILTSDHGYHMGEKEMIFKNTTWEESTRIPMVISGPGIADNVECSNPVSLIDLYPTIVDFCKLPTDPNRKGNGQPLDGFSLVPLIKESKSSPWEGPELALTAICSQEKLDRDQPGVWYQQHYSVRSERYRYILYRNGEEELYDHLYDPYEWNNLASDQSYSHLLQDFNSELHSLIE